MERHRTIFNFCRKREFKLEYKNDNSDKNKQTLIWDVGQTEHELTLGGVYTISIDEQKKLKIELGERTTSLLKLEYIN